MNGSRLALLLLGMAVALTTSPPGLASTLIVKVGPGVAPERSREVEGVLTEALSFFASEFAVGLTIPLRVSLHATTDSYVNALITEGVGVSEAVARQALLPSGHWMMVDDRSQVFVNLGHPGTNDRLRLVSDLSHEVAHVYHFELSGRRGSPHAWIMEGTAEVFAKRFLDGKGLISYSQSLSQAVTFLKNRLDVGGLPSLNILTTQSSWLRYAQVSSPRVIYTTALTAVDHLTKTRSKEALLTYFRLFRAEPERDTAFQQAFGLSHGDFAARFFEYLKALP